MITFKPWRPFVALRDRTVDRRFLTRAGEMAKRHFADGMNGSHSGRTYIRPGGRVHQASAPGEFPAKDSGALLKSIGTEVTATYMRVGTNMPYSIYLRYGTSKMAPRKMSKEALTETWHNAEYLLKGWIRWQRL